METAPPASMKPTITPLPLPPSPFSLLVERVWPRPATPASRRAIAAVGAAVALSAIVLIPTRPGLGWPLVGLGFTACALGLMKPVRVESVAWCAAALAMLSVGAIRSSGQLFAWCVIGAFVCGSLAVAGGRTVRAMAVGAMLVTPAGFRGMGWWANGAPAAMRRKNSSNRLGWAIAAMVALIALFGALFASADPVFAHILAGATSGVDVVDTWRGMFVAMGVAPLAIGVAYLASARPRLDQVRPLTTKTVRRLEWALPVAALDLLFLGFVVVQLDVLFGGSERVQSTAGLTYADYARSGFWQLLAVAGLTLALVGVVCLIAPKETTADRVVLRVLLGALATLTLVIVASALHRMSIYDQAYGYTRERLAVSVIEIWLGAVFALVIAAGVRLRAPWLARAAIALGVVALLTVSYMNPDGFIASRNVTRYQQTGRIDIDYLSQLSPDAASALNSLPLQLRNQALFRIQVDLGSTYDGWRSWNLGRQRARAVLE